MIMVERKTEGLAVCSLWKLLPWRGFYPAAMFHQSKQGEKSLEFCREEVQVGRVCGNHN